MFDNHPLVEAARYNDAQAEEFGILETINSNDLDPLVVMHVAQQRALRLVVLSNYGVETLSELAVKHGNQPLNLTDRDKQMIDEIAIAFIDGIMIGWKGNIIHSRNTTNTTDR